MDNFFVQFFDLLQVVGGGGYFGFFKAKTRNLEKMGRGLDTIKIS